MLSLEEAQMRMNGRYGGSASNFPCDYCVTSPDECPCHKYEEMTLVDSPQYWEMSDSERFFIVGVVEYICIHYGNIKVGYPCETMNRWLFGLDDEHDPR